MALALAAINTAVPIERPRGPAETKLDICSTEELGCLCYNLSSATITWSEKERAVLSTNVGP